MVDVTDISNQLLRRVTQSADGVQGLSTPHRRAMSADPRSPVLALDVGGTKLAAGVADADGQLRSFVSIPTGVANGPAEVIDRLTQLGHRALKQAGGNPVSAVGIGCGGPLDPASGLILGPPGLPGWNEVPLRSMLSARFGIPVYVENDATAAALGEYRWGGWNVRNLVYLTLSTGFGGGVISDGVLFHGAANQGGEFGHIVVDWQGRECGCGARGCAEAYVSGTSIARRATEALLRRPDSSLATLRTVTAKDVFEQARAGDALAEDIWNETTAILGRTIAAIVNVCEPEMVVLGGGVTRAGDYLLRPVREAVLRQAMLPAADACKVVLSNHGDRVGVLGAAAIAYHRMEIGTASPYVDRTIAEQLDRHIEVTSAMREQLPAVQAVAEELIHRLSTGGVLYTYGNGGSAADAQHLVAELIGRYLRDHKPLSAVALIGDAAVVSCIANDYSYNETFARQVRALARPADMVIGFSTSGTSPTVVNGLAAARAAGACSVAFTSTRGSALADAADMAVVVPAEETARIQEMHGLALHLVSELVDRWAADKEDPDD
ncbi:MAG: glucokinase [Kribbellaceae bacterium]|nr:glucokinase [Kribbellaceae bacterium]